jgi:hypothetical protein
MCRRPLRLFRATGATKLLLKENDPVIYTIIAILIVLWVVANIASYTLGGLIHILLVVAAIVLIYNLVTGRRR